MKLVTKYKTEIILLIEICLNNNYCYYLNIIALTPVT